MQQYRVITNRRETAEHVATAVTQWTDTVQRSDGKVRTVAA